MGRLAAPGYDTEAADLDDIDPITAGALARVGQLRALVATLERPEDALTARDNAAACVEVFKRCRTGLTAQNLAAEVKIRLERRLGELIGEAPGRGRPGKMSHRATLPIDLNRRDASRLRKMASVPEGELVGYLLTCSEEGLEVTSAGVLRLWRALNKRDDGETVTAEVEPDPPDDDEPIVAEFWKSANTCRDEVKRIGRKLKDVKLVLSGLVESPYEPLLKKAAYADPLVTLAWDGDHTDGAGNGAVTLVSKVYTCPAVESLTRLVAGLELLFDREVKE